VSVIRIAIIIIMIYLVKTSSNDEWQTQIPGMHRSAGTPVLLSELHAASDERCV